MKIYLACPYSHKNGTIRHQRFIEANDIAAQLMKQGHHVFSPISHTHPIAIQCDLPLGFDFWEEYDTCFIGWCDEVFVLRLNGWAESKGVKAEIKIATKLKKPVRYI